MMNRRRAHLDAADEDDLLRLQAEFQAAQEAPCVAVTSVGRGGDVAAAAAVAAPMPSPPAPPCPGGDCTDHHRHHHHAHAGGGDGDRADGVDGAAAPAVTILGAVRERNVCGGASAATRPPRPGAAAASGAAPSTSTAAPAFPQATHRRMSKFALSRRGGAASTSAATASTSTSSPSPLDAMSPSEIAAAQAEIRDRLPASAIEFLRRRGAAKEGARAAAAAAPAPVATTAAPAVPPSQGLWRDHQLGAAPAAAPAAADSAAPAAPTPAALRIRWSLDGSTPLALSPPSTLPPSTTSMQRDPLRVADAASPGYTLPEAAALARSALPAQRAAAAGVLGGVCAAVAGALATGAPPISLEEEEGEEGEEEAGQAATTPIPWPTVAASAYTTSIMPLRLLLDDPAPSVVAAAAAALAAALLPPPPEAPAWAGAAAARLTGSLLPSPRCWATRRTALSAWTCRPVSPAPVDEAGDPGETVPAAAAADPLAGLVQADLLPRAAFLLLLAAGAAPPSSDPAPLALIEAAARGGGDTAVAALACPGLVERVVGCIRAGLDNDGGGGGGGGGSPAAVAALTCLGLLAAAAAGGDEDGRSAARQTFARAGAPSAIAAAAMAGAQGGERGAPTAVAALRAWRATAASLGLHVLHLDEAFPGLGPLLMVAPGACSATHLTAATEALNLVAALAPAAPAAAAALAADAAASAVDPSAAIAAGDAPGIAHAAAVVGLVAAVCSAGVAMEVDALVLPPRAAQACLAAGAAALESGAPSGAALSAACCELVAAHLALTPALADVVVGALGPAALAAAGASPPTLTAWTPALAAAAAARRPPLALLTAALSGGDASSTPSLALAAFRLASPGDEALALHALTAALAPGPLASLLAAAHAQVAALAASDPVLAAAAAGGASSKWPCPPAPPPPTASMSSPLTNGYAAAWLGLVPQGEKESAGKGGGGLHCLLPTPASALPGSRLPPPPAWPVLDFGDAASHAAAPPRPAAGDDAAAAGAGAALRLWLGVVGAGEAAGAPPPLPSTLLPATLDALFGDAEPWRDAWGRWAGAALLARAAASPTTLAAALGGVAPRDAHRWAAAFAADSFGDPLLACAVSVLLAACAPPAVQGEALAALEEGDALHLLPAADAAPGGDPGVYGPSNRPADFMHRLKELRARGRLDRAVRAGSLVAGLVV